MKNELVKLQKNIGMNTNGCHTNLINWFKRYYLKVTNNQVSNEDASLTIRLQAFIYGMHIEFKQIRFYNKKQLINDHIEEEKGSYKIDIDYYHVY